jgi:eukaryotic-like serine/threonine-protein kinase
MFEKLGKFEIKRVLGNGAMGEVYLGVDPSIGREVAIKTILPSAAQGGEAKERFAREARAAGVLNHPNLVTIYEFGEDQGVLYIAMEFVRGHDLEELLRDQSLSRSESLEILAQVCDGLGFAHRQQIVHRDIKPTNVRVQRDGKRLHAKVMDFGVAKINNSDMTATGMVMGTVSYMAPEYIRTGKPDPRSDLFAVGVMLYECLNGRKPFSGDTTPTVLYKIVNETPDPIDIDRLHGISPAIRTVLDRSLCKNPNERYQTAEDLAKSLRAAKDPSWMGQIDDTTSLLRASAPTVPATPVAMQPAPPTVAVQPIYPSSATTLGGAAAPTTPPAPPPESTPSSRPAPGSRSKGLWIGFAALALVGVGAGSWWVLKGRMPDPPTDPSTAVSGNTPSDPGKGVAEGKPRPQRPSTQGTQLPLTGSGSTTPQRPSDPGPANYGQEVHEQGLAQVESGRPTRPAPVDPKPETKAIDQPGLYQQEKLDKLQVHERLNLGNVSLSEAIQLADSQPDKAIHGFRQALKADPGNINAHAWLAVVLYDQGRMGEFVQELRESRRQGILGHMAARNIRFKSVLNQARFSRKLPPDLAD